MLDVLIFFLNQSTNVLKSYLASTMLLTEPLDGHF